jgi:hypothetical protein
MSRLVVQSTAAKSRRSPRQAARAPLDEGWKMGSGENGVVVASCVDKNRLGRS